MDKPLQRRRRLKNIKFDFDEYIKKINPYCYKAIMHAREQRRRKYRIYNMLHKDEVREIKRRYARRVRVRKLVAKLEELENEK